MKGINLLSSQVSMLRQCNFKSSTRALNVRLLEADINILSSSLFNFSTFHSLLRGKESSEDYTKNSTFGKEREIKTSIQNAFQSKKVQGKTLQKSKSLVIKPEINLNDLQTKIKQINKFISKGLSVTVKVDNPKNVEGGFEKIFSHLQKSVTENQISAKISKTGHSIILSPIHTDGQVDKKSKEEKGGNSEEVNSENEGKS